MELHSAVLPAAGGVILGLLLGIAISGSGHDAEKARQKETKALAEKLAAVETSVAGLGDRIGGIEGALKTQGEGVAALGPKIDEVATTVTGSLDKLGGGVSEAVKSEIAGLKSELSSMASAPSAGTEEPIEGKPVGPGATVVFDKDKMRVFVSSIDPSDGSARVAVNGRDLMHLKLRSPYTANGCTIELNGFNADGQAVIGGGC